MAFSFMVRHVAESKAEKNPIGIKPVLKVGTYWVSTKPTDNAPQVHATWEAEKKCDCEGPVDSSISIIFSS